MNENNINAPPAGLSIEPLKQVTVDQMSNEINEAYKRFGWGDEFFNYLNNNGYKASIKENEVSSTEGE
jgi:hypothetical protein